jgi:hypothetical protein
LSLAMLFLDRLPVHQASCVFMYYVSFSYLLVFLRLHLLFVLFTSKIDPCVNLSKSK